MEWQSAVACLDLETGSFRYFRAVTIRAWLDHHLCAKMAISQANQVELVSMSQSSLRSSLWSSWCFEFASDWRRALLSGKLVGWCLAVPLTCRTPQSRRQIIENKSSILDLITLICPTGNTIFTIQWVLALWRLTSAQLSCLCLLTVQRFLVVLLVVPPKPETRYATELQVFPPAQRPVRHPGPDNLSRLGVWIYCQWRP